MGVGGVEKKGVCGLIFVDHNDHQKRSHHHHHHHHIQKKNSFHRTMLNKNNFQLFFKHFFSVIVIFRIVTVI